MFYSVFLIPFIIVVLILLIPISNANPSVDNNMLIAFVKGNQETKISEYSMQKYQAYIGIVHFMRENWHCDKIHEKFEEFERTECQKYRKYLDILYEYLCREYVGIPTVKPKFVFKYKIEIDGPIIYSLNCLVKISLFYMKWVGQLYKYKLSELFGDSNYSEPKLLNEERLNYELMFENEPKMPINEMILQLAIDTANNYKTNESLIRIFRQNFDKNLEEMFKRAEEMAKKDRPRKANEINDVKHLIIIHSKFDDQWYWEKDALFSEFIKGLATNSEKFFKMAKEYSIYLSRKKEKGNIHWSDEDMIALGLYKIEQMKKHLTQKYKAHLVLVYLMRKNWNCDKIGMKFTELKNKCQKYGTYLDILFEYLFRLYVEAKKPKESKELPALVKPIFIGSLYRYGLIELVRDLDDYSYSNFFCKLENEEELNFERSEKKNWSNKIIQKRKQILNGQTDIERIWEEFEQKMKKMHKSTKQNAKKLKKTIEKAVNNEEKEHLINEYNYKFGISLIRSPFYKKSRSQNY